MTARISLILGSARGHRPRLQDARAISSLQFYYDRTNTAENTLLVDHQGIYDIDFQHDVRIAESNELIWGAGYRSTEESTDPSVNFVLNPSRRQSNLFSGFTQDEFALLGEHLRFTVGTKLEHNIFTGFEIQPNARVAWSMTPRHSAWAAVSRAVRTPSRSGEDTHFNLSATPPPAATPGLPVVNTVLGNHGLKSEDMIAYEAGYRIQPARTFSADVAAFYNSYTNLISAEPQRPFLETVPLPVHITAPLLASNKGSGTTYGTELVGEWNAGSRWKLSGSYSFLRMNIHRNRDSLDVASPDPGGASPRHQYYFRSSHDLPKKFEQDLTLRYVAELRGLAIPGYYSVDARIGWKPTSSLDFSVAGKNLFNDRHLEFVPDFINTRPTQVKRTINLTLTWSFK